LIIVTFDVDLQALVGYLGLSGEESCGGKWEVREEWSLKSKRASKK